MPRASRLAASLALLVGSAACASPAAAQPRPPGGDASPAAGPAAPPPAVAASDAEELLFPGASGRLPPAASRCRALSDDPARIDCLLDARYAADRRALALARRLFAETGHVAGLLPAQDFDGGYRGVVRLEPTLPVARHRRHLEWVAEAAFDYERFFADLARAGGGEIRFRWRAIALRFYRSVKRSTPAAFAIGWTVSYNVAGSINKSADRVRETLFHEIFHLNDADHGDWSPALADLYDGIKARCGTKRACLAPYSPGETMVRGGTYYAFQPGNDVREYAAELALRYYREQREALAGRRLARPAFKCGPPENAEAWARLAREFFGGVDLVPPCGR